MNIALYLQHKLLLGVQRLMGIGSHNLQPTPVALCPRMVAASSVAAHSSVTGLSPRQLRASKSIPLRVLRVVETDTPRNSTGRLVISGRMVDVCAELDRLVEREAAMH